MTTKSSANKDVPDETFENARSSRAVAEEIKRQIPFSKYTNGIKTIHRAMNKMNSMKDNMLESGEPTFEEQSLIDPVTKLVRNETILANSQKVKI